MPRRHLAVTCLTLILGACGGGDGGSGALYQDGTIGGPDVATSGDASASAGDVADDVLSGDDATPTDAAGDTAMADDTAPSDVIATDTSASGPTLTIVVEGALDDRSPDDGLASQTPSTYIYGLQRLELLRSTDDPHPAVVFDYAPDFVPVDMLGENVVARVPIASLPEGTFPYFRIVLTHCEVVVDATLHQVPVVGDYPTQLDIVYGLSDVHSGDLDLDQGDAVVSADIYGQTYAVPTHWGQAAPNPGPNAWAEAVDGEWRVSFGVQPALRSSPATPVDVTYAVRFYVTGGFRWQDQASPGYTDGVWDLSLGPPASFEPVKRLGANTYDVYYQGQ